MERKFFSGSSVEQAVLAAARHYRIEPERVAYRVRDKKHGFLRPGRQVVIEVDPAAPERAEAPVVSSSQLRAGAPRADVPRAVRALHEALVETDGAAPGA